MSTSNETRRLVTLALVALAILVLAPGLLMGFGMFGYGMPMTGYGMPMMGGSFGFDGGVPLWVPILGFLMQLLFLLVLVGGGYLVYRAVVTSGSDDPALDELRLAYARGDLTDEEYESRREALERES